MTLYLTTLKLPPIPNLLTRVLWGTPSTWQKGTHQADEQEKDEEGATKHRLAVDITVTHRRHGDDEEVDARPIRQLLRIVELHWVSGVLQL